MITWLEVLKSKPTDNEHADDDEAPRSLTTFDTDKRCDLVEANNRGDEDEKEETSNPAQLPRQGDSVREEFGVGVDVEEEAVEEKREERRDAYRGVSLLVGEMQLDFYAPTVTSNPAKASTSL